ncbi:DUF3307 domain-containing protein [Salinisphaera sp. Q1T1-3]|uniref:DUF3307 domain-containing protein n=1 Tax=Salinisphaera sp. Q1T1-3 TaxID=2321229 RepID=UPI000E771EC8|nr:DUF3307 domain-containing protein [Salinisphaera sp. Q1T1-3]RJS94118.1 DUF3307 domain-containing protein [Salinisphaera sp. Q1T1-3]
MIRSFVVLLFAHVLADFVMQTGGMVAHKRRVRVFGAHIVIVALTAAVALAASGAVSWMTVGLVTLAHAVIDAIKIGSSGLIRRRSDFAALEIFAIDQAAHLVCLAGIAIALPTAFIDGGWPRLLAPGTLTTVVSAVSVVTGFIVATRVGALLIGLLMQGLSGLPASSEASVVMPADDEPAHRLRAGVWIGWLERVLVFVFVLLGQFGAIGFVIAAKSVLRFEYARKVEQSELVIIGTLASFGWAILVALATRAALSGLA